LSETGYVEGRNVETEYRWGEGQYERLPALAVDLVQRRVAVIAATGSANAAESAKAATSTIPIVFANGSDPVKLGIVSSLNRPGGNATGISFLHNSSIVSKRLDMLRTLVPKATTFAFLVNPDNPATQADLEDVQSVPRIVGQRIIVLTARTENEIDAAYATLVQQRASELLVNVDAFFYSRVEAKRLELLHELLPAATTIAYLVNPTNAVFAETESRRSQVAARILGMRLLILNASDPSEFEAAFATLVRERAGGLVVDGDAVFINARDQLFAYSGRHAPPAIFSYREDALAGGLMSYGVSLAEIFSLVGVYTGRILKGERPADLPVQQATRIQLMINLKTAKAIDLTIPEKLLATADEVIQ
jgi:ABC-type uncharacterized transport system substrate-binding protein